MQKRGRILIGVMVMDRPISMQHGFPVEDDRHWVQQALARNTRHVAVKDHGHPRTDDPESLER